MRTMARRKAAFRHRAEQCAARDLDHCWRPPGLLTPLCGPGGVPSSWIGAAPTARPMLRVNCQMAVLRLIREASPSLTAC